MTREEADKRAMELAMGHYDYIEELLEAHHISRDDQNIAEFHYLEAFKHGYKHCWEDVQQWMNGLGQIKLLDK